MNHVQTWAEKRLETLRRCSGQEVRALDFRDDRLADGLSALSRETAREGFEAALNGHLRAEDRPQLVKAVAHHSRPNRQKMLSADAAPAHTGAGKTGFELECT